MGGWKITPAPSGGWVLWEVTGEGHYLGYPDRLHAAFSNTEELLAHFAEILTDEWAKKWGQTLEMASRGEELS